MTDITNFTVGDCYNALEQSYEANVLMLGKSVADSIERAKKEKVATKELTVTEIDIEKGITNVGE